MLYREGQGHGDTWQENLNKSVNSLLFLTIGVVILSFLSSLLQEHPIIATICLVGFAVYIVSIALSAAVDCYSKIRNLYKSSFN